MNAYRWDELAVGLKHGFEATITQQMVDGFAAISGDVNPLHVDREFAAAQGFPAPVVYGLLTASLYSQLVSIYLPGKFGLLHGIDIDFHAPCFVEERIIVEGEIAFLSKAYRRMEIKATMRKLEGKIVSKAKIRAGLHA